MARTGRRCETETAPQVCSGLRSTGAPCDHRGEKRKAGASADTRPTRPPKPRRGLQVQVLRQDYARSLRLSSPGTAGSRLGPRMASQVAIRTSTTVGNPRRTEAGGRSVLGSSSHACAATPPRVCADCYEKETPRRQPFLWMSFVERLSAMESVALPHRFFCSR